MWKEFYQHWRHCKNNTAAPFVKLSQYSPLLWLHWRTFLSSNCWDDSTKILTWVGISSVGRACGTYMLPAAMMRHTCHCHCFLWLLPLLCDTIRTYFSCRLWEHVVWHRRFSLITKNPNMFWTNLNNWKLGPSWWLWTKSWTQMY